MENDMNIQKYRAFVTTVEQGSFSKAAELLDYSQSGMSRMISDLEHEWHLVLLHRDRSGVRLTSDGLHLLPFARSLVNEYDRMQQEVDELNGLSTGLIRIGTFSSVATHWLPRIIKHFQRDYPKITFELLLGDYTEIEQWLKEGRVDCGFLRQTKENDETFDTYQMDKDQLMAVIPLDHPLAKESSFPLSALEKDPFILLEKGGKSSIAELIEHHHLKPQIAFTTWDDYAVMSMVEQGLGISILPGLILKRNPYHVAVLPLDPPAWRPIVFAVKDMHGASTAVKHFFPYLSYRKG